MNSPAPSRPRRHVWRWILGGLAVSFVVLVLCMVNLVTLTRDAAALRRSLLSAGELRPSLRVQASVGPLLLGATRWGLRFVPDLPAEARHALAAVRSASVSVSELREELDERLHEACFTAADALMTRRGWIRAVGVRDGSDTVLVFTRADAEGDGPMRVCVAVCSDRALVVVDAVVNASELAELVAMHAPKLPICRS